MWKVGMFKRSGMVTVIVGKDKEIRVGVSLITGVEMSGFLLEQTWHPSWLRRLIIRTFQRDTCDSPCLTLLIGRFGDSLRMTFRDYWGLKV